MYCLQLEALAAGGRWAQGLAASETALAALPVVHTDGVSRWRVKALAACGKSAQARGEMARARDLEPAAQAALWGALAAASAVPHDQLAARRCGALLSGGVTSFHLHF